MRRLPLAAGTAALVVALTGATGTTAHAQASGGARAPAVGPAKTAVAVGTGGGVASESVESTQAGIDTLKRGGNAVDAAVATAAAMGVTHPDVAGPGGGGYMVIYLARSHRVVTVDGRERCAAACTRKLFVDPRTGKPYPFELARHSGISVGVPGMVAEWDRASRLYGRRSFAQNLQPAIGVARRGFVVDENFHASQLGAIKDLRAFTSTRRTFLTPSGDALPVGSRFRNPQLARTYEKLARYGPGYLYGGPLGARLAATVQHPPVSPATHLKVLPGLVTAKDVAAYRTKVQAPTHVRYRGVDVYGMAPSSSGGTTMGEALNILSGYDLGGEARTKALYQYLEASRISFADRNRWVGDPAYVDVPQHGLLSKGFAASRRCLIKGRALASPLAPGSPFPPYRGCSSSGAAVPTAREGTQTNHLVTSDRWGNVVSYTNTIEELWGSGMAVPGAGFMLNNEMTDFDFAPITPGVPDPNLPAAGKRSRSSMSPTLVLRHGRPWLAVGSPGGATIITTTLQTLLNRVDFGMTLPQAVRAPRASQRDAATSDAEPAFRKAYGSVLTGRYGEKFAPVDHIGFVNALELRPGGTVQAVSEPVRVGGGSAMVVHPR